MKQVQASGCFTACILISMLSTVAIAQNTSKSGVTYEIGAKAGVSFADFSGHGVDNVDDGLRMGFTVLSDDPQIFVIGGIMGAVNFGRYFALQPEVLYQRAGKRYEGEILGEEIDFGFNIDYLTIPLLVKVTFPSNDRFRTSFYAGPHLSIKLNATLDNIDKFPDPALVDLGPIDEFGRDEDIDEETSAVDVGVSVGVGLDIRVGPGYIVLDGRYMRGFVDVFDVGDGISGNLEEIKNQTFALMVGYSYQF